MNDLVKRLRNRIGYDATVERMIDEAANEIERLHLYKSLANEYGLQVFPDLAELREELERLRKIEAAAKNLIAQKGRHNTEQAYRKLEEAMK